MMHRLAAVAVSALLVSAPAQAEIKLGFITALSGPAAALGIPYANGMKAARKYKAKIGNETVTLIQLDDGSDPAATTRNARKLVEEEKVDILIGTATAPGTIAMATIANELGVPMIAVSPIKIETADPAKQWTIAVPQPPMLMAKVVADRMKRDKVHNVGYIGFSDAWGDLVYAGGKAAEARGDIKLLTNERYARTDTSVTAQILRILATKPDGVLIGGSSTQAALPLLALADRGFKGHNYGLASLINPDFVRVGGKAAEGVQVSAGPVIVSEQLPDGHFSKKLSADFRAAYKEVNGSESRDGFSAYSFDAYLIFAGAAERALGKAKPGTLEFRKALRDEMLNTKELAGVHAVYNFKPGQGYGVDDRSLVIVKLKDGKWIYAP
ncbi:MAG: ABC transporter substrate-binding protein [Hyphomicrobiales bacterium]|nr:ABC transporter substrate-binding protein [Rhodoblastus sp.]MCB9998600.1 ABC transporter substrate-binding protein [Methylobacteriaceae bacterium]MCC2099620.1 ABC transporter substrate-binding protein [Hyphomicrobiales bacterium]HRY04369.1 ABC transporter substrate-binding protein [Beijerinckiaceae bacterium]MCB1522909.1 ABC transporter substrate-binding protein [Rhodoblastus sp.]